MRVAQKATDEVGQLYVYSTFDLGVCMKAYPIIWNYPEKFSRHVIMVGTFHLAMGYYKMIGKKMEGSGLSDVLLEANMASPGSLQGVINGKNYSRATHCHKTLVEALHRLMMQEFLTKLEHSDTLQSILLLESYTAIVSCPSMENLEKFLTDDSVTLFVEEYLKFGDSVRAGQLGKTAQFWISYIDKVTLVLSLRKAVKTNDFELYAFCLSQMSNLFFAFGGQNYARYLTYFSTFISNVEFSHPGSMDQLKLGVISVARSFVPGNRCAVDKTMEETFMKHAKSRGGSGGSAAGICGISQNYPAYQRWTLTTHERSKFLESTYTLAGMVDTSDDVSHRDTRAREKIKSERCVENTVDALRSFLNPFTVTDKEHLYSLSSGRRMPDDVEKDVLNADKRGQEEKDCFVNERLKEEGKGFFDPVKKLKLRTMSSVSKKVSVVTKNKKVVELKQQGNIAFQLLVKSQSLGKNIDLLNVMKYQLTPVPYCIGTSDGYLGKTNKAKGYQHLTKEEADYQNSSKEDTLLIVDGNAVFHCLTEVPDTFKCICEKIFKIIPGKSDFIFSTDTYSSDSIKEMERKRRGLGEVFLVKSGNMKRPADWKGFLSNNQNKQRLAQILLEVWSQNSFASNLLNRKVMINVLILFYIYLMYIFRSLLWLRVLPMNLQVMMGKQLKGRRFMRLDQMMRKVTQE